MESVASSHRLDNDGVAFHLGNASGKCGKPAVNVVWRCEIDVGKYFEKQVR
jgi:hypothetical protein